MQKRQVSLQGNNPPLPGEKEQYAIYDEVDAAAAILDLGTATYVLSEDCRLPSLRTDSFCKGTADHSSSIPKLEGRIIQALHDAFSYSSHVSSYQFVAFTSRPPLIGVDQGRHVGKLRQLIQELSDTLPGIAGQQRCRALVLRMHCNSALIHVATRVDRGQCSYDAFTANFCSIVQDAELWVHDDASTSAQHSLDPQFISILPDIGIIGPLFEVANKCRHPYIRRRAIALLEQNRYEGPWGSKKMAQVAHRALTIEEGRTLLGPEDFTEDMPLSVFIPERHRLTAIGVGPPATSEPNTDEVVAFFRQYTGYDEMSEIETADDDVAEDRWRDWQDTLSLTTPINAFQVL